MSYVASTVSGMTKDHDLPTAVAVAGPLDTPLMTRWRVDQLKRAQRAADALGLTRSDVLRFAFDQGIAAVEALAATAPVDR